MRRLVVLFFLMGSAVFSTVLQGATAKPVRTGPVSDSQIDATIRAKLAKSKIGKDGFTFHVSHGVVTWEGKTNVIQHKGSATRMAHAAGATQVVNRIQIADSAKEKTAGNLKKAHVEE